MTAGTPARLGGEVIPQRSQDGTLLGQPAPAGGAAQPPPPPASPSQPRNVAPAGMFVSSNASPSSQGEAAQDVVPPPRASGAGAGLLPDLPAEGNGSGTLLGVARPGIAPTAPGLAGESDLEQESLAPTWDGVEPTVDDTFQELGATLAPRHSPTVKVPRKLRFDPRRARLIPGAKPAKGGKASRQALWLILAGAVIAVASVLFVVLWPDPPPVTAQAREDANGNEVLEVRCPTCPDGTVVSVGTAQATAADGTAQVPLPTALPVGPNRLKIALDRPGSGRDETLGVTVNVAYRISPDLGTLQGERPAIQVAIEAAAGTEVTLGGNVIPLSDGRAVEVIDVSDAINGPADEPRTLARQIPYTVKPVDGPREQGVVSVSVGIVQLRIDAPGPSVVIEKESFVLEGRTAKGAKIFAGTHPIPVQDDGTFRHEMNVSSVGSTQFAVRAKLEGMAPRIVKISVRRVDRLETAAKEFFEQNPVGWAELFSDVQGQVGKAVVLTGEVLEMRRQGASTVLLLSAPATSGCKGGTECSARLVHGMEVKAQRGDTLTAYGRVVPPLMTPGGPPVPEMQVEFVMKNGPPGR
ncbi:uncharacterized protein CMC5_073840 [Chondromyces crocatus]|uniref:Uncharacterized protein n=2 Tax=Chondromyces crocatus TaxID=52 RepID=A0A0K1EQR9_CHOCO|nr:uncharacterized protein CMC5_073840 [Chondromyces crocatus]